MHQFTAQSWVILIAYLLALFVSMIIGAYVVYLTKSPFPLALPGLVLSALKPIVAKVFQTSSSDDSKQLEGDQS